MRWLKFLKQLFALLEIHEKMVAIMAEIPKKVITMAEITLAEIILKRDRSGRKSKKL
jgi:hypothetical protein